MKNLFKILFATSLMAAAFVSCDDDDDEALNNAFVSFRYDQDYLEVSFTSTGSSDILDYIWSFGDGDSSFVANPTHVYDAFGDYTVTLVVNEGDLNEAQMVGTVSVTPPSVGEIASLSIGGAGAAEISAFDASNERLFVVNNDGDSRINIINFSQPDSIYVMDSIMVSSFGGGVNSVAVGNGQLAAAIEADDVTDVGLVVVWDLEDLTTPLAEVTVGALPDMVTFTGNGNFILCANEGEPNDDYTVDPVGSVSIINTSGFGVATAGFSGFNAMVDDLAMGAFRVFGPGASLEQDVEPEYIAVSEDNTTAYVSLQENNGVAIIDIASATVSAIIPLGLKDYSLSGNEIDPSDEDNKVEFRSVDAFGMYQPDALASYNVGGTNYIISANEGDAREYEGTPGFIGEDRVGGVDLDDLAFSNATSLQSDSNLGRLKLTVTNGDLDGDDDYDQIWSYGARSFSIWNGETGELVWDSGNELEVQAEAQGLYDDTRSDDKGVEPEGVALGVIDGMTYAFIGLERVDAVAVYDVTVPQAPVFITMLETGDAPEGIVFISAEDSPSGSPVLVVSSEDDGTIKVFEAAF
ncbi:MAG: choice-of-anchor I family protein [Bacteroidota bacterium]